MLFNAEIISAVAHTVRRLGLPNLVVDPVMVAESGADEVMVQDLIADPVDRRRSHELLAQVFGLGTTG